MKGGIYMAIFYAFKKKFVVVLLLIAVICSSWGLGTQTALEETVSAQEYLNMYSGSYALMDGDTNRVLVGKEETNPMANASTTKILTCIVTLENCDLEEVITISANAAGQPKVRYGVQEGEQYQLKDLVYGLMLESYNDCAVAIAEHVAGSEENFAKMLNEKAKAIGCLDTYFITPNGLDAENDGGFHHTTAADLCKIMAYCVWKSPANGKFLEITQTRSYGDFVNRNSFFDQMDGVLSGKTGFTAKAGYCYVAALEQNGERYTIALLACGWPNNKNYKWHDAKTLFSYALETYDIRTVEFASDVELIEVEGYTDNPSFVQLNQNSMLEVCAENREYQLLMSVKEQLRFEKIWCKEIELPIEEGTVLGEYKVYLGEVQIDTIPLIAVHSSRYWYFEDIFEVILFRYLSVTS